MSESFGHKGVDYTIIYDSENWWNKPNCPTFWK